MFIEINVFFKKILEDLFLWILFEFVIYVFLSDFFKFFGIYDVEKFR